MGEFSSSMSESRVFMGEFWASMGESRVSMSESKKQSNNLLEMSEIKRQPLDINNELIVKVRMQGLFGQDKQKIKRFCV